MHALSCDEKWILGRLLYDSTCRADPSPDDVEWVDLDVRERLRYRRRAIDVVDGFLALREQSSHDVMSRHAEV